MLVPWQREEDSHRRHCKAHARRGGSCVECERERGVRAHLQRARHGRWYSKLRIDAAYARIVQWPVLKSRMVVLGFTVVSVCGPIERSVLRSPALNSPIMNTRTVHSCKPWPHPLAPSACPHLLEHVSAADR
eukprot:514087-Rhodomonas_salina.1